MPNPSVCVLVHQHLPLTVGLQGKRHVVGRMNESGMGEGFV